MKNKRLLEPILTIVFVFVTVFNMIGVAIDTFGNNMEKLPEGTPLFSVMSPDGLKTLRIYRIQIKNIGTAIRGETITTDKNNQLVKTNIYWETNASAAIASWKNEDTVEINNNEVKIDGAPYDSRTQIELPEASAKNRLS